MSPHHELIRGEDLAGELDIPKRTLDDWRYRRVGPPFVKVGTLVRYRRSDVDAWLTSATVTTTPTTIEETHP